MIRSRNRLKCVTVGIFMFSIIAAINGSPVNIIFDKYNVKGSSDFFWDWDVGKVLETYEVTMLKELSITTNHNNASSTAARFFIENSCENNDVGHSHNEIYSEAYASAEWIFSPVMDGGLALSISGLFEWDALYDWGRPTNKVDYLKVTLEDYGYSFPNDTIISKLFNASDFISQNVKNSSFVENFNIRYVYSTNLYRLRLEGFIGSSAGFHLREHHMLSAAFYTVPETNTIIFLLLGVLPIFLLRKKLFATNV